MLARCAAAAAEHGNACIEHLIDKGYKLIGRTIVNGLAVNYLRHTGVGLGYERNARKLAQALEMHEHLLGPCRAVKAESAYAHALQNRQCGRNIGSGQTASALVAGERHKNGLIAHAAHSQHRRARVGKRHHRFYNEKIYSGLLKTCGLLGVDIHKLLKRRLAERT